MRRFALSFLLGAAMTISALSAVAQPIPVAEPAKSDTGGGSPDNQTYMQAARERIRLWRQEVTDFDKKADTAGGNVQTDLDTAWTRTKAEEDKLETTTANDWERAKAKFDRASSDLEDALQRARVRLD
jgi:opacity protein-like surface antigen